MRLWIPAFLLSSAICSAQQTAPAIYQRYAPVDLTGTWVSVVTEDWAIRMLTPSKANFVSLPLNAAGQEIGKEWDPARDQAAGEACKSYAAPALLRIPGRLKIAWQDGGNTLRIDADAGQQTRLLQFANSTPPNGEAGWQGYSVATWEYAKGFNLAVAAAAPVDAGAGGHPRGAGGFPGRALMTIPDGGDLRVVTTHLKPGYLRKNGVPFSQDAMLTEYFNIHADPYGT